MSKHLPPFIPAGLVVDRVISDPDRVTITTHPSAAQACCPACGRPSSRMHSHYTRTLADLPWQGRPVTMMVQARLFRCATAECPRRVFAERCPRSRLLARAVEDLWADPAAQRALDAPGSQLALDSAAQCVASVP